MENAIAKKSNTKAERKTNRFMEGLSFLGYGLEVFGVIGFELLWGFLIEPKLYNRGINDFTIQQLWNSNSLKNPENLENRAFQKSMSTKCQQEMALCHFWHSRKYDFRMGFMT